MERNYLLSERVILQVGNKDASTLCGLCYFEGGGKGRNLCCSVVVAVVTTHCSRQLTRVLFSCCNMALIWSVVSVSCSILVMPFLMFLLAIIFLASIGKSLGVRRLYVKMLLKIFEVRINNCKLDGQ